MRFDPSHLFLHLRAIATTQAVSPLTGAAMLEHWLQRAPILVVPAIERAMREPRHEPSRRGLDLTVTSLPDTVGVLGVASCQRDGFQRQAAIDGLIHHEGRLTLAFLANRLNDPVPTLRELAAEALRTRIVTSSPKDIVAVLPLLDGSLQRQHVSWERWIGPLLTRRTELDPVLDDALASWDSAVRLSALRWRLDQGPPISADRLRSMLRDGDPSVRAATLRCVLATPAREALLPTLLRDPDAHVRLAGLRLLREDGEALRAHIFDRNANNRFMVRTWLQQVGVVLDYRALALQALEGEPTHLLGALGLLAETGQGQDLERVRPLIGHGTARVSAEAGRTVSMLLDYVGPEVGGPKDRSD